MRQAASCLMTVSRLWAVFIRLANLSRLHRFRLRALIKGCARRREKAPSQGRSSDTPSGQCAIRASRNPSFGGAVGGRGRHFNDLPAQNYGADAADGEDDQGRNQAIQSHGSHAYGCAET